MGTLAKRPALLAWFFAALFVASFTLNKSRAALTPALATLEISVTDELGHPLLARLRIEAASWRERARLGAWKSSLRAIPAHGLTLALAPGAYRYYVSLGPEWSLAQRSVELGAGERRTARISLAHQVSLSGWRAADLHVHTKHSADAEVHGGVDARDLRVEGIELAAGTDHNHVGDLGPEIESVAGAEITTWAPEVGHFNAFPLRALPRWRGTTPEALFAELRAREDTFVQINHPRLEDHIAFFTLGDFDGKRFKQPGFVLGAHGLEVWNGYQLGSSRAVRELLREFRAWVASGQRLTATGGSDSHGVAGHLPGYPRTYARAGVGAELAPALKQGRAFVTNGPLLNMEVSGAGLGEQTTPAADGTVEVELTLLAPDWLRVSELELWAGERLVWSRRVPMPEPMRATRHRERVKLNVRGERTLLAVARGGSGLALLLGRSDVEPFAFTNPVYLRHHAGHEGTRGSAREQNKTSGTAARRARGHEVLPDH